MEFIKKLECPKCKSKNLAYNKVYWDSKRGPRYRYLIVCVNCYARYFMKRKDFDNLNPGSKLST